MPGPPDYDGVCQICRLDEYVCECPEPDLVASAVYYALPEDPRDAEYIGGYAPGLDDV